MVCFVSKHKHWWEGSWHRAGMSKRTSYGKFYRPDVCLVQTSVHVRTYSADAVLPADGLLPSVPTVKIASPRARVRVDPGPHGRVSAFARARISMAPCPGPGPGPGAGLGPAPT
jgi:hypothetical protein